MNLLEIAGHINVIYNLGDIADWVSAIGTLLAVITSVYLANRHRKPFLAFYAHYEPKLTGEEAKNISNNYAYVSVSITNYANRPVVLIPKRHQKVLNVEDALFINEYQKKFHSGFIEITNFTNLEDKLFMFQDNFTGKKYYFALRKKNDEWIMVYPLNKLSVVRRMIHDRFS